MFPKKSPPKKPGLDVAVMVGKPGAKSDLDSPVPVDGPKKAHEADESPAEEANEDYGAKLVADIEAVGEQHGMDAAASRAAAGAFFRAAAECLIRDAGDGMAEHDAGGMEMEGG